MTDRAYSTLQIKTHADAGGKRRFTGVASTVATDRMQDIVVPRGMRARMPTPLCWQHDQTRPIGWVRSARVSDTAIEVDCEVHDETQPGVLKNFLDQAWQSIVAGLVRGLSIGFRPLESSRIEGTGGTRHSLWELLELSAVLVPANADCGILSIKSLAQLQATKARAVVVTSPARVRPSPTLTVDRMALDSLKVIVRDQVSVIRLLQTKLEISEERRRFDF